MAGKIEVLSGAGHEDLVLPENHTEAKAKVDDLLQKGYNLVLSVEGADKKISGFDGATGEYLVTETVTEKKELRYPSANAKVTAIAPVAGG